MLAIHKESSVFDDRWSDRWIAECDKLGISYKVVNCYSTDILKELAGCAGVMWHWNQQDSSGALFARQLFAALNASGVKTFPDFGSVWHHDDKVGQKYLLEAIGAPLVPTYIFYDREEALSWSKKTSFPKVFKLRGGAGSVNVKLCRSQQSAKRLISKSFGRGFAPIDRLSRLQDRLWRFRRDGTLAAFKSLLGGIARLIIPTQTELGYQRERGYVYFQEFIPGNSYDTRLVVVGDRCFGVRRFNRAEDFRASGSGVKDYDKNKINREAVKIAFDVARKIGAYSMSFDFLNAQGKPKIVEISYCYIMGSFYDDCPGYWNSNLEWIDAPVNPQKFIIEDFVAPDGGEKFKPTYCM